MSDNQLPAISRIAELKIELDEIARIPRADMRVAVEYVRRLVRQFPHQGNVDEETATVFGQSLAGCCVGAPIYALEQLIDVKDGLATKEEFLSLAKVSKFLAARTETLEKRIGYKLEEIEQLEDRSRPITPEEREANANRLHALADDLRGAREDWRAQKMQEAKSLPGQIHDPAALMDALSNLDAMRRADEY